MLYGFVFINSENEETVKFLIGTKSDLLEEENSDCRQWEVCMSAACVCVCVCVRVCARVCVCVCACV